MKDYHDLYLKCDVLLVVDVFEKFGNSILKNYGLCPRHYLAPACHQSCDSMLNMIKVELELIPDGEMYLEEFITFLRDIVRSTISILNLMN